LIIMISVFELVTCLGPFPGRIYLRSAGTTTAGSAFSAHLLGRGPMPPPMRRRYFGPGPGPWASASALPLPAVPAPDPAGSRPGGSRPGGFGGSAAGGVSTEAGGAAGVQFGGRFRRFAADRAREPSADGGFRGGCGVTDQSGSGSPRAVRRAGKR
jgi:hypothetical protein